MSNTQMANMADLAKGLAKSAQTVDSGGGNFMKFAKGEWMAGVDEEEIEAGTEMVVNVMGITCGHIKWQDGAVDVGLLPGAIGYISISEFRDTTPNEVLGVLEQLKQAEMLALVLDLRLNSGGSIEAARKVASQFLPTGLFMYEVDRNGNRTDWFIEEGGIATEALPLVVMVDEFTTDAAEAIAGALQDAQRSKVLGARTPGKGAAMSFVELSDGSAIRLPVSRWYTPLDSPI